MLSIAIIIFREILEIALIVGVLLAATRGLTGRRRLILGGVGVGVFGAVVLAYFAGAISETFQGLGQEIFNGIVLVLAAFLIGWTLVWMKRYGRMLTQHFHQVGQAICKGERPLYTLATVTALSVLREGSEIVLFSNGVLASGVPPAKVFTGSIMGFMGGGFVGGALYYGLVKVSPKLLFSVTSWFLVFLAAGMMAQAAGFFSAAGILPELVSPVWDTSRLLPETSSVGHVFHSLFGYTAKPSGVQLVVYVVTLGGLLVLLSRFSSAPTNTGKGSASCGVKTTVTAFLVLFSGLLFDCQSAFATKKVYEPYVYQGEAEVEARGNYDFDHKNEKDGAQKQKYAVGYGVTDRWFTEVYGEWEKKPEEDFEFESVEWENRFQLTEQGQRWVDVGLYFAYEFASKDEANDNTEGKLLLAKSVGDFTHVLNLTLEKEIGDDAKGLEGGFAWSTRYRWKSWLEPGFEIHSDLGELRHTGSFDEQQHEIGPVIYGKVGQVRYDVGYLFGVSDAAPDGELKWIVEWEQRF